MKKNGLKLIEGSILLILLLFTSQKTFGQITPINIGSNNEDWREEYAYSLGYQAYLFGYPYANMAACHYWFHPLLCTWHLVIYANEKID